ncbi:membrane-associated tyrosine- and threonine-specific cdc2-inhibitory kinase-like isoform X2 [Watersipora subatra]|uniref:membrane-associated tyrosine- and threonine-specific cdc2-inhibitory kinase-like isoform X2 n=1 Tax=Watersipora subatra TaxID=2589382 RepID=UPI00355B809E
MSSMDIMPAIPNVNIALGSPHRPTPKFFLETKTFSTKKERENTPRSSSYPRPPIKSCPPISRLFQQSSPDDRPRIVSFKEPQTECISPLYNNEKQEVYFHQCFNIEKKIGSGSFGDVYQVRSKEDGRQYAVKRSRERFKGDLDRKRKLEEVSKHELLPEHPHCVKFYRAWEERQHLYIQTELCDSNLGSLAERQHEIPEKVIWNYLIDLLMAVKHLHDHELIHMDIKPDNIFIAKDGTCQLGDFGLILDLSKNKEISEAQEGDPKYLAPELLQGKFTKAADIFSLGITILELASDLDLPRGDEGWHQLRMGKLPENIVKDRMSKELEYLISLMMEPDHTIRPTADALLNVPVLKRIQRYKRFTKSLELQKKKESSMGTSDGALNSSLESNITYGSLTDDVFSTDENVSRVVDEIVTPADHSETETYPDFSSPYLQRALTTGAKRRYTRSARLAGMVESPTKTPLHGSPRLSSSSRTRSSKGQSGSKNEPSSTTPPSCRKKMLFDDEERSSQPIGPKNLMSMFDTMNSDDDDDDD